MKSVKQGTKYHDCYPGHLCLLQRNQTTSCQMSESSLLQWPFAYLPGRVVYLQVHDAAIYAMHCGSKCSARYVSMPLYHLHFKALAPL